MQIFAKRLWGTEATWGLMKAASRCLLSCPKCIWHTEHHVNPGIHAVLVASGGSDPSDAAPFFCLLDFQLRKCFLCVAIGYSGVVFSACTGITDHGTAESSGLVRLQSNTEVNRRPSSAIETRGVVHVEANRRPSSAIEARGGFAEST